MKLSVLYLFAIICFLTMSSYAQVAVIANKSVSAGSISAGQLNDIYSLKTKTWSNGSAIVRFTLKDDSKADKVFGSFGKSSADLKKLWMKLQLTGEGQAPQAVGSADEIIDKVASTPGAIGFVDASKVNDKVKVLLTIN